MIRKLAFATAGTLGVMLVVSATPALSNDRGSIRRVFGGDTDNPGYYELEDDRRREVFDVIDDFRDELEDVVGRRESDRIVRAIRRGDDVDDLVDDLDLSDRRSNRLDDVFDDIRDGIDDILD